MAPSDPRALYARLVATLPGVELKGDTIPYTSINGHMFSNLTKAGTVSLRLPDDAREAFLAKYNAKLAFEYGIVRKEYVEIPSALLAKTSELKPYFAASHAWVKSMKPKPTTKSKPKAKPAAATTKKSAKPKPTARDRG